MSDGRTKYGHLNRKEGGYALLVVLVLMILTSIFMMSFYSLAISARQQQNVVEDSTIGVGVAEMGITYFHYEIRSILEDEWSAIRAEAEDKLKVLKADLTQRVQKGEPVPNIGNCGVKKNLQEWADCKAELINDDAKNKFRHAIAQLPGRIPKGVAKPAETSSTGVTDKDVTYKLTELKVPLLSEMTADKKILTVELFVTGTSNQKQEKMTATMDIHVPSFLSPKETNRELIGSETITWKEGNKMVLTPPTLPAIDCPANDKAVGFSGACRWPNNRSDIMTFIGKLSDPTSVQIQLSNLCKAAGVSNCNLNKKNFRGVKLYVKPNNSNDELTDGNLNSLTNANIYYDGMFDVKNWNSFSNNQLIVRSLDAKNDNSMTHSKLLILGNEGGTGTLVWKKVTIGTGSSVCVNLSGIQTKYQEAFKKDFGGVTLKGGKIIFYPSRPTGFPEQKTGEIEYEPDFATFINACLGNGNEKDKTIPTFYGVNMQNLEISTEARYRP